MSRSQRTVEPIGDGTYSSADIGLRIFNDYPANLFGIPFRNPLGDPL